MGAWVLSERVHARIRSRASDELSGRFSRFVPALGRESETVPRRVPHGRTRILAAVRGAEVSCGAPSVTGIDPATCAGVGSRLRRKWERNHGWPAVFAP